MYVKGRRRRLREAHRLEPCISQPNPETAAATSANLLRVPWYENLVTINISSTSHRHYFSTVSIVFCYSCPSLTARVTGKTLYAPDPSCSTSFHTI